MNKDKWVWIIITILMLFLLQEVAALQKPQIMIHQILTPPIMIHQPLQIIYTENIGVCGKYRGNTIIINTNEKCDQDFVLTHEVRHFIYQKIFSKPLQIQYCKLYNLSYGTSCREYFSNEIMQEMLLNAGEFIK